ncbi:hypothetical protein SAMN05216511_7209 [Streptomyces sp. KS_16]|uniref:hypothetical protein n=1 Tax=unclassified Streptomyces TaxID=2593676 RepID=UPI000883FF09|nr:MULTISPECIES: hypothetical protein [unclassified Streptomyces]PBC72277.1 hypothetical protein BX261_7361 [Streptomyces sp. 2321.6]SDR61872.1 hypothetical protein SAMN05216511_7209 [Streptomyces sp. KS_16]SNC77781.1 hypothetical protein SAMN06272741_7197 [Streptomyces sp. 2114.4]
MTDSPKGERSEEKGAPDLVSFADMPARLEASGLKKISPQRIRQLAETDPDWPIPMDEATKVGRIRVFDWHVLEPYFTNRKSRQGQRTDRMQAKEEGNS